MTSDEVGFKGQDEPPQLLFLRHVVVLKTQGTVCVHFQPVNQNHKPSMSQAFSHIPLPLNKIMKVKMKMLEDFWFPPDQLLFILREETLQSWPRTTSQVSFSITLQSSTNTP